MITDTELLRIVRVYQTTLSLRQTAKQLNSSKSTIRRRLQLAKDRGLIAAPTDTPTVEDKRTPDGRTITSAGNIRTLAELLEYASVDLDQWVVVRHKVNKWDSQTKGGGVVGLFQVTAHLERRAAFFVTPVEVTSRLKRKPLTSQPDTRITLIVPDSQHGFRRTDQGLITLHDRRAVDCAIQAARFLADKHGDGFTDIILLGDMLDLAPFSKYPSTPDLRYTTNQALRELFFFLSELRKAAPKSRIRYAEGNHELRIHKALTERIDEALHLRPATVDDDAATLFSIPHLLSLDQIDVEYIAPYGKAFFHEGVRFSHGSLVRRRGGQTVGAYLNHATASGVFGHIHRLELAQRRIDTPAGAKVITAMSPGCLCRVDGVVPAATGDTLDWQHGLGLMYASRLGVHLQLAPILDGVTVIEGHTIAGQTRAADIEKATGIVAD